MSTVAKLPDAGKLFRKQLPPSMDRCQLPHQE